MRTQRWRIFCQRFCQHTVRTQLTSIFRLRFSRVCFQTLYFLTSFMCSETCFQSILVHFRRGVPPEAYQRGHSEAQWCHMVARCAFSSIFHRFWGPFWEAFSNMLHHFRHPVSECFFEGVSRRTCDDFGSVWEAFLEAFSTSFQEQVKS